MKKFVPAFVLLTTCLLGFFLASSPLAFACTNRTKAQFSATLIQISYLTSAIHLYKKDVGEFPSENVGLNALIDKPDDLPSDSWRGPYLKGKKIPDDAWGMPFSYEMKGESFEITSDGFDNEFGTEDDVTKESNYSAYRDFYGNNLDVSLIVLLTLFVSSVLFKIFHSKIGPHPRLNRASSIILIVSIPLLLLCLLMWATAMC